MKVTLSLYKKIFLSPSVRDLYNLVDESDKLEINEVLNNLSTETDLYKLVDVMESDLSHSALTFTSMAIVHNYKLLSSDLSNIIHDELSRKMAIKLREQQTIDAFNHVMKLANDLVTYREDPSDDNFKTILETLKVEDNVIKRLGRIHNVYKSKELQSLHLNLGYTQDKV